MNKLILLIPILSAVFSGSLPAQTDFWTDLSEEKLINSIVLSMTDDELLGQVLFFGYSGHKPSRAIISSIKEKHIGGIKIFGWNAGTLETLVSSIGTMQKEAQNTKLKIPLFIATDQEGGWVRHIKGETSITPGNLAIGASGIPDDAYKTGRYIGFELRTLGINMNFAPTVDVYTNPEAHVIGPRAFSSDPVQTAILAAAYYRGMKTAGIICTAKHFPGHGNADADSHGTLPIITVTFEEMWNRELIPYRFLIKEGIPAIMSGHLGFPKVTGNNTPASLSSYFQTEILRNNLNFKGIVVTDDLVMNGVQLSGMDITDISKKALKAGNDMILISRDSDVHERVWNKLSKLLQSDNTFRTSIVESVKRILKIKIRYLKSNNPVPLIPEIDKIHEVIPNPETESFFFEQACRSVTLIKNKNIPLTNIESRKILLAGQFNTFLRIGKIRFPNADQFYFPYSPFYSSQKQDIQKIEKIAGDYDTIIFCLANPNSMEVLKSLKTNDAQIIVISVLTPVYIRELPWISSALAVYGTGEDSFEAGFAVLLGDFKAEGSLPITISCEGE